MKNHKRHHTGISTGSMADIAFLLLIFFLVTTTIKQDKGLTLKLPPKQTEMVAEIHDRNLFTVNINSKDQLMIEGEVRENSERLREEVKHFILNPENDPNLAESPTAAIISLKTNRGTTYKAYIEVLDELQGAYYEIYGERVNMTSKEFRKLDPGDPKQKAIYMKGKSGIPMNISIAEPQN